MVRDKEKLNHFKDYLLGENRSKETISSYIRTTQQFLSLIGTKPGDDVSEDDLRKFKIWVNKTKKYDSNTLTPKFTAINKYLEYLKKPREWRDEHKLVPPKKVVKNKESLTREEVQKIFKVSEDNPRNHAILKVLYYTSLRRSEIINLNIEDIKFDDHKVFKNNGKGNNYAVIEIHPDAIDAISVYLKFREPKQPVTIRSPGKEKKRQRKQRETDQLRQSDAQKALFLSKDGYRLGKTAFYYTVKKYAAKANITKRVYPHLFRISSITHMAERGLSIPEIMRQSTHSDPKVVMGYIQLTDKHIRDAYLRGLSFDEPTSGPKHEMEKPVIQQKPLVPPKLEDPKSHGTIDLERKLIIRLANGEISNDVYSHAILRLKQGSRSEDLQGYR